MKVLIGLTAGIGALCLPQAGTAKATLQPAGREIRIDPSSLVRTPHVYHVNDVVIRALLRSPSTTRTTAARSANLFGFPISIPAATELIDQTVLRSPNPRMFSKADGRGTKVIGAVFCSRTPLAVGPFTTGDELSAFKGRACFLDADRGGVFEALTLISLMGRETGPVPIESLPYAVEEGTFSDGERVDLVLKGVSDKYVLLRPMLYDAEGRHGAIRLYTNETQGPTTIYSEGCQLNRTPTSSEPSSLMGVALAITASDAKAQTVEATIASSSQAHPIMAEAKNSSLVFDFIPRNAVTCGDKQRQYDLY